MLKTIRALGTFLVCSMARGQMVTGERMTGFAEALRLAEPRHAKSYQVEQLSFEVNGPSTANVLWPGESTSIVLLITNLTDRLIDVPGSIDVIRFSTRAKPADVWSPDVIRIADCGSTPISVKLPPHGSQRIQVSPGIPEIFGGYALVADLGPEGRSFAGSLVRAIKPDEGKVRLPTYALDFTWDEFMSETLLRLFKKLGVKGARMGAGFVMPDSPEYGKRMGLVDRYLEWAERNDVTVMLTIDNGAAPMPLGRPRPWLSGDGHMLDTKDDRAWLPRYDEAFERWTDRLVTKYGWPHGPVNAVELWNEPWEGISISGWGADIPRFREIYEHMAKGVEKARAQSGVKVLIGGACSSTNTRDKLFPDGSDKFLKWLDFVSIHYQPLSADPALVPEWMHRKGPYGRVQVWDTESWIANSEDRLAGVIASMRAQGQDRTAGVFDGNVYDSKIRKVDGKTYEVVQAWPPAAALAATQKFIGQRAFREILFKNGLPWVFVFDGLSSTEDGTVVVLGDLGAIYEPGRTLFRSVKVHPGATLIIDDASGAFTFFDCYGNQMPADSGRIAIPLNGLGYFLRGDGQAGSFEKLLTALRGAAVSGYDPVEIKAKDFTRDIADKAPLNLTLTNILNRVVTGTLTAQLEHCVLGGPQKLQLGPHETRQIAIPVQFADASPSNTYRLSAVFDAGADGKQTREEVLHANVIARRTIHVDGDLQDWTGILPQTMTGAGMRASLTEEAWLPFKRFAKETPAGVATGYLAYDERYFYFAARIADDTPEDGMLRFADRNDDAFFYPQVVFDKDKALSWPTGVRHYSYRKNFEIPSGNEHDNVQIAFNVIPADRKPFLPYPQGTMPYFEVYADTDYEFALNPVAPEHGGGSEVWKLLAPGMPRKHFFPRQPKAPLDGGPVKAAQLTCRRDGNTRIVEAAIPWTEIPEVKSRLDRSQNIKFSFRVNNNNGPALELSAGRSVAKQNQLTFHDDWTNHWSNELEFGFAK